MLTAVIVQARMGSSRLPGKVLESLGPRTVLAEVLARCAMIRGADVVVCAVPDQPDSDPVSDAAEAAGTIVFRGPERDVLARYLGAARAAKADIVMRVTSDCPLIDPSVCGEVLALRAAKNADYASNNMQRTFPHGLDCEAFTTAALIEADKSTQEAFDREHVTPWLRRAFHMTQVNLEAPTLRHADERWTLDFPEDLTFMRAVFAGGLRGTTMQDTLRVLDANPKLRDINAQHRRQSAEEKGYAQ